MQRRPNGVWRVALTALMLAAPLSIQAQGGPEQIGTSPAECPAISIHQETYSYTHTTPDNRNFSFHFLLEAGKRFNPNATFNTSNGWYEYGDLTSIEGDHAKLFGVFMIVQCERVRWRGVDGIEYTTLRVNDRGVRYARAEVSITEDQCMEDDGCDGNGEPGGNGSTDEGGGESRSVTMCSVTNRSVDGVLVEIIIHYCWTESR